MKSSDILSIANNMLVWTGVILAGVTIVLTLFSVFMMFYFRKGSKKTIKQAIDKILNQISKDSKIRNELISKILSDDKILKAIIKTKEFKEQLDLAILDQKNLIDNIEIDNEDKGNLKEIDVIIDNEKNLK
ncbi:hypothetical protein [Campylobacter ureolyticus]|uniref:Uncharacterized protein n=1 Tax=Campylobacter ureolyticus TaxID=827 RepID=A0A9Q4PSU0_9BACT|nr:hypothetical protein [Campylobacter ureolyticus]MCZ6102904.1 hypothetical protein [Campylobacter ureolyticus]MCZ6159114.1 hypothetical protein [Campylobacter ureolyticus]